MPQVLPEFQLLVDKVAGHLHAGQKVEAARLVLEVNGSKKIPRNDREAEEPLAGFLSFCLSQEYYEQGAQLLWTPTMFTSEPECTKMVWSALRESSAVLLMGASSMSKTYGCGVFFFLEWLRDPMFTTVKILGPSEDHLQANLFSHLVNLHRTASLTMPGIVGDLFIGLDLRNRRSAITGVVVPLGRKAAGRLQGTKRFPRPVPHAQFGPLSRLRVLLDEFEKIPPGIHSDLDNIVSNTEGTEGLKVAAAFNPQDVGGKVYEKAEPEKGWPMFDIEKDTRWRSKRGWEVVRLDGEKSENVISGKVLFPGLQTKEGIEALAKSSGGTTSAGYHTFGRAAYPPQGSVFSVIPANITGTLKAKFLWLETPKKLAAVDSALEGGDLAEVAVGDWGLATGLEYPPSIDFPNGNTILFKDAKGNVKARHGLQLTQLLALEKGNTITVTREIKRVCQALGVDPGWLMLDRTGNGAGVHDLLKEIWAAEVRAVNYSESATHTKILTEDTQWCDEAYKRIYNEIWFATRKWSEFGIFKVAHAVNTEEFFHQITTRQYNDRTGLVESKKDWKSRNEGKSPNKADAVNLLVHCARMASGVTPGMILESGNDSSENFYSGDVRVGVTDRLGDLDGGGSKKWYDRAPFSTDDNLD